MRLSSTLRASVIALAALAATTAAAYADSGTISIKIVKGGFFVGGSGGSGTLSFQGHSYPLSIGGISAGLVFGVAEIKFSGTVSHLHSFGDIAGVYGAAGAGAVADHGRGAIVLTNPAGVVLDLSGQQTGLMFNIDLSGMAISLK